MPNGKCGCLPNCLYCSSASTCDTCSSGYYLDKLTKTCIKCNETCTTCFDSDNCKTCQPEYYLEKNTKQCEQCPQDCFICFNSEICLVCFSGYLIQNGKCLISYLQKNKNMENTEMHKFIQTPLIISTHNDLTSSVTPIVNSCIMYSFPGHCAKCRPGFYFESGKCLPCSEGCLICDYPEFCLKCRFNYEFLNQGNKVLCKLKVIYFLRTLLTSREKKKPKVALKQMV
jgi:hypothetical protein